jgi:hypothetical protein
VPAGLAALRDDDIHAGALDHARLPRRVDHRDHLHTALVAATDHLR